MKSKAELTFTALFIIFLLIMLPNENYDPIEFIIILLIFLYIPGMILIWTIKEFLSTPANKLKENFKKQHIIIKILYILAIISLIYEAIMGNGFTKTPIIILMIGVVNLIIWFFTKEE